MDKKLPANAGDTALTLGLRRFHTAAKPMCYNYQAQALEPVSHNY